MNMVGPGPGLGRFISRGHPLWKPIASVSVVNSCKRLCLDDRGTPMHRFPLPAQALFHRLSVGGGIAHCYARGDVAWRKKGLRMDGCAVAQQRREKADGVR